LTASVAEALPREARVVVVEDFTKVFLDDRSLSAFLRDRVLAVRARIEFAGFVVALRELSRGRFSAALADPGIESLVEYNPYEAVHA
jgi:hypothetical protein